MEGSRGGGGREETGSCRVGEMERRGGWYVDSVVQYVIRCCCLAFETTLVLVLLRACAASAGAAVAACAVSTEHAAWTQ